MPMPTVKLGGTASNVEVGKVGEGLMLMTWKPTPVPDKQCFEIIKGAIDGESTYLNSGEFYGMNPAEANPEMIARFVAKFLEYKDNFFLSVKGGMNNMAPDSSEENLRHSVEKINAHLGGNLKSWTYSRWRGWIGTYLSRLSWKRLEKLRQEGKFGHIGISEASAETLRRACKVAKVAAIEIEISPWSWEEETQKVIAAAHELDVAVIGYSPLGRAFLTGAVRSLDQLEEGDRRRAHERFHEQHVAHNLKRAEALTAFSDQKGITPAQLCIAWVSSLDPKVIPLPGSSHPARLKENIAAADVVLSERDLEEMQRIMRENPVSGSRYAGHAAKLIWG